MFNSLMMLALEANGVVALRMMKLMRGGWGARAPGPRPYHRNRACFRPLRQRTLGVTLSRCARAAS
jgi:hypothetical protein